MHSCCQAKTNDDLKRALSSYFFECAHHARFSGFNAAGNGRWACASCQVLGADVRLGAPNGRVIDLRSPLQGGLVPTQMLIPLMLIPLVELKLLTIVS